MDKELTQENIELLRDQTISHVIELQTQLKKKIQAHVKHKYVTRKHIDFLVGCLIEAEKANEIAWNIPDVPSK